MGIRLSVNCRASTLGACINVGKDGAITIFVLAATKLIRPTARLDFSAIAKVITSGSSPFSRYPRNQTRQMLAWISQTHLDGLAGLS
jgi:hypothetical protein